ncbi:MAG: serine hydrolase domain-containing protein, partial [Gaiellales bacterium]
EELTGRRYQDVVRERVLAPLGMVGSDPAITSETRKRLAVGYDHWYDDRPARRLDPMVPATWVETGTADGSIAASAEELAVFLRMLLKGGQGLLSPESFALMTPDGNDWTYGYGLESRTVDGQRQIRHGGSMPGFGSTMLGDLAAGMGAVVLLNMPDEGNVTEEVATAALDFYRVGQGAPSLPDPLAVENAQEFEGAYSDGGLRLVLTVQGERLVLVRDEVEVALEPRGDDRFFADHPEFALFLLTFTREDGVVVEACHGSDVYVREGVERPSTGHPPPKWSAFVGHYRAYNPWITNFRVILRRDRLVLVHWWGSEDPLTPLRRDTFRVGDEDWSPERLHDGEALRANLSGCDYYRIAP